MSTSAGPRLLKDGLLFGYDTGYTVGAPSAIIKSNSRFYKGRPTTNYVAYNNAVSQTSYTPYSATSSGTWNAKHPNAIRAYNAQGTDITGYVNTGVTDWTNTYHAHWRYDYILKKPVVVMDCFDANWKAKSFDCNTLAWTNYGMTTGSKYVISWLQWTTNITKALQVGVYCRNAAGTANFHDGFSAGSATSKNTKPYTWQRVYHTYTVSANHSVTTDYDNIYMYGHSLSPNGAGVTIKIADVQLELNIDTPSPFIPQPTNSASSVRSSTGSILDLKKTLNVDVTNVSFSTDGLPTFDGTNDTINIGNNSSTNITGDITMELVLKRNSTANMTPIHKELQYTMIITSTGISYADSTTWNYSTFGYATHGMNTSNYYHIVATRSGTTVTIYVNGVSKVSKTFGTGGITSTTNSAHVGSYNGASNFFNGQIPIAKLYSRAISFSEVQQNYKAYKKRFHL